MDLDTNIYSYLQMGLILFEGDYGGNLHIFFQVFEGFDVYGVPDLGKL